MAEPVLYIAAEDNVNTVAVDLNALGAAPAGLGFGLAGEPDFGSVEAEPHWIAPAGSPDAVQAGRDHGPIQMVLPLWLRHSTAEDGFERVRTLNTHLDRHGVIVWEPSGGARRYIDYYPSSLPGLLRGQERGLYKVLTALMDPDGLPVEVWRHPYARGEVIAGAAVAITNGPLARELQVSNPGNVPALTKVTVTPTQSAARLGAVYVARRSRGDLAVYRGLYGFEVEAATALGTDTASAADANASGSAAQTTFTTQAGWAKRWRHLLSPSAASAIKGRFQVIAVVSVTAAGVYQLQARWVGDNREPAEGAAPVVEYDADDLEVFDYAEVPLGIINSDGASLSLEGWARRVEGSGNLRWDMVLLVPVDEQVVSMSVPGLYGGGTDTTVFKGVDLATISGTVDESNDNKVLNAAGEVVGTTATAVALPVGRHMARVMVALRNKEKRKRRLGYLRVVDGAGATVTQVALKSRKGKLWTKRTKTVRWTADSGTSYRIQVVYDAASEVTGGRVVVQRLRHSFSRYVDDTGSMEAHGVDRTAWAKVGTATVAPLYVDGFLELEPGENVLVMGLGDLPSSGYDDVVDRPLVKHVPSRAVNVVVDVTPRYAPL